MESDGTAIEKNVGSDLTASDRHVIPGAAMGQPSDLMGSQWVAYGCAVRL